MWTIKIKDNSNFCGVGAGGVQFAGGTATIDSKRMAAWFSEHDGYTVISNEADATNGTDVANEKNRAKAAAKK